MFDRPKDREDECRVRRGAVRFLAIPSHRFVMVDGHGPAESSAFEARMPAGGSGDARRPVLRGTPLDRTAPRRHRGCRLPSPRPTPRAVPRRSEAQRPRAPPHDPPSAGRPVATGPRSIASRVRGSTAPWLERQHVPRLALEDGADRRERREPDRPSPPVLQHGQVHHGDADAVGQLGQGHAPLGEDAIEMHGDPVVDTRIGIRSWHRRPLAAACRERRPPRARRG